ALELRNHILHNLEEAAVETDPAERRRLLTFAVIGGGPTGVEYAGALSELLALVIPAEYPELSRDDIRILMVEALPSLLSSFPEALGAAARAELAKRGIEVLTSMRVVDAQHGERQLSSGESIPAGATVWAAGVKPESLVEVI